jgi:hypothetical protein
MSIGYPKQWKIYEEQKNPNPTTPPHSTLMDNNSKSLPPDKEIVLKKTYHKQYS